MHRVSPAPCVYVRQSLTVLPAENSIGLHFTQISTDQRLATAPSSAANDSYKHLKEVFVNHLLPLPPRKSVLLVDDEPNILKMLSLVLTKAGFDVRCVESGFEGLRFFHLRLWDAVITDRAMPGVNGEEMAARMREHQPNIPILMLTGMPGALQHPELFDAVLPKPFLASELLDRLTQMLRINQAGD